MDEAKLLKHTKLIQEKRLGNKEVCAICHYRNPDLYFLCCTQPVHFSCYNIGVTMKMFETGGLEPYDCVTRCDNKFSVCRPNDNNERDKTFIDGPPNHPSFCIKDVDITSTECTFCYEMFHRQQELN